MVGEITMISDRDTSTSSARRLALLDSGPSETFDSLTRLATQMFRAPMGMVSLVDGDQQWFRSQVGLGVTSIQRAGSFCEHAMMGTAAVFEVCDALNDPRFAACAYVQGEPHIRYYAGAVLRSPEGEPLGTLCIADTCARTAMDETAQEQLRTLAAAVEGAIQLGHELRVRLAPSNRPAPSSWPSRPPTSATGG